MDGKVILIANDPHQGYHRRASAWSGRRSQADSCLCPYAHAWDIPRWSNIRLVEAKSESIGWNIRTLERKHGAAWSQHRPVGARAIVARERGKRTPVYFTPDVCWGCSHFPSAVAGVERQGLSPGLRGEDLPGSLSIWGGWKTQHRTHPSIAQCSILAPGLLLVWAPGVPSGTSPLVGPPI